MATPRKSTAPAPKGDPVPLPPPAYRPSRLEVTNRGAVLLVLAMALLLLGAAVSGQTGPRSMPQVTQTVIVEAPSAAPATPARQATPSKPVVRPSEAPAARAKAPAPKAPARALKAPQTAPVAPHVVSCHTESNVKASGYESYARVDHWSDGHDSRVKLTRSQYDATHC